MEVLYNIILDEQYEENDLEVISKILYNHFVKINEGVMIFSKEKLYGLECVNPEKTLQVTLYSRNVEDDIKFITSAFTLAKDNIEIIKSNKINKYLKTKEELECEYNQRLNAINLEKAFNIDLISEINSEDTLYKFYEEYSLLEYISLSDVNELIAYYETDLIIILRKIYEMLFNNEKMLDFDFFLKYLSQQICINHRFCELSCMLDSIEEKIKTLVEQQKLKYIETISKELSPFIGEDIRIINVLNPNTKSFKINHEVAGFFKEKYEKLESFIEEFRKVPEATEIKFSLDYTDDESSEFIKETLEFLKNKRIVKDYFIQNNYFEIYLKDVTNNAFLQGKWFEHYTALSLEEVFNTFIKENLDKEFKIYQGVVLQMADERKRELDILYVLAGKLYYLENKVSLRAVSKDIVRKYEENKQNLINAHLRIIYLSEKEKDEKVSEKIYEIQEYLKKVKGDGKKFLQQRNAEIKKNQEKTERLNKSLEKVKGLVKNYHFPNELSDKDKERLERVKEKMFDEKIRPEAFFDTLISENDENAELIALKNEFEKSFLETVKKGDIQSFRKILKKLSENEIVKNDQNFSFLKNTLEIDEQKQRKNVKNDVFYFYDRLIKDFGKIIDFSFFNSLIFLENSKNIKSEELFSNISKNLYMIEKYFSYLSLDERKIHFTKFKELSVRMVDSGKTFNSIEKTFFIKLWEIILKPLKTSIADFSYNFNALFEMFDYCGDVLIGEYYYNEQFLKLINEPLVLYFNPSLNNFFSQNDSNLDFKKLFEEDTFTIDGNDIYFEKLEKLFKKSKHFYFQKTKGNELLVGKVSDAAFKAFILNKDYFFSDILQQIKEKANDLFFIFARNNKKYIIFGKENLTVIGFKKPSESETCFGLIKGIKTLDLEKQIDKLEYKYTYKDLLEKINDL